VIKLITTDSFDFGEASSSLVPLHRRGVDSNWMLKHANHGMFNDVLSSLRPMPNHTVLHIIALGDEERYGPNRNCDGFSGHDNKTAHVSFKEMGHVFRNHKNDDPEKKIGSVLATAHNPMNMMSRVELLVALNNILAPKEVDDANSGKDIPFSMGSKQDHDVCSLCNHKAEVARDHCDHIKHFLGEVTKDGQKIYMKNPKPKYFDISAVHKPADRIAYSLRKVASHKIIGGHELAEMYGLTPVTERSKLAFMHALAELVKEIPASAKKVSAPLSVGANTMKAIKKCAEIRDTEQMLAYLTKSGKMLNASDFADAVLGHDTPNEVIDDQSAQGLDDLLEDGEEVSSFDTPPHVENAGLPPDAMDDLQRSCSMEPHDAQSRAITIIIKGAKAKTASKLDPVEAQGLAMLYKHYKVAFAYAHRDRPEVVRTVAATF